MLSKRLTQLPFLLFILIPLATNAQLPPLPQQALNKVSYQLSVEKWAQTKTAKVTVGLDAVLDKAGLSDLNNQMLESLKKIAANGDWHIVQMTRSQDKSGLETVHIEAQARLPEANLASLRASAKDLSKPGQTYTVSDIDFTPSMEEMEKAHANARNEIYNQINQEVARLNQVYPDQQYFLFSADFTPSGGPIGLVSAGRTMMAAVAPAAPAPAAVAAPGAAPAVSMAIDTKIVETAQVVIASLTKTQPIQMRVLPEEKAVTGAAAAANEKAGGK